MQDKQTRSGWYIVQVVSGSETRMCGVITKACAAYDARHPDEDSRATLNDCFSPCFASRKKRMGKWYDTKRALLPGYVIADTRNPAKLAQALRTVREFCRVLANDDTYSPLNDAERRWMESQSSEDDRTIPLSFGVKEGDKLTVTSGPLKGHEGMIEKVDRKNCMAHVVLHAGQITLRTTVGLVLLPGEGKSQS